MLEKNTDHASRIATIRKNQNKRSEITFSVGADILDYTILFEVLGIYCHDKIKTVSILVKTALLWHFFNLNFNRHFLNRTIRYLNLKLV